MKTEAKIKKVENNDESLNHQVSHLSYVGSKINMLAILDD